ncbi:MAG: SseB family protein [Flavisolibacter sp.]|nr:SseB family protein [Flavisolibacter sp.]
MSLFKKWFGSSSKSKAITEQKDPDNTRLLFLIDTWVYNPTNENYRDVLNEIENGNSFLLLPTKNSGSETIGWSSLEKESKLNLTSVYNLDGLKVLAAFTDENALLEWSKKPTQYTALHSQDVIEICKSSGIDRVVINNLQKNMFVLERNRSNITTNVIEKETEVLVGTPIHPLSSAVIQKLNENFQRVDTIEEAYQFAQSMNGETSLVLAVKMSVQSDNARAALHNAINDSINADELQLPLDIMIISSEDWLNAARNVQNSFVYKKQ